MPRLDEGDLAIQVWRLPSVSLDESVATCTSGWKRVFENFPKSLGSSLEQEVLKLPLILWALNSRMFSPFLKPKNEWVSAKTKDELIEKMKQAILASVHGVGLGFTQPIEMRFNELIAGTRSDIAVKIFGEDLSVLRKHAEQVASLLQSIPGGGRCQSRASVRRSAHSHYRGSRPNCPVWHQC